MNSDFKHKLLDLQLTLTFDDVLIKPRMSNILPVDVDLSVSLSENLKLNIPILSAAMDTVTDYEMARAMIIGGGCGPLHKNSLLEKRSKDIKKLKEEFGNKSVCAVAIGAKTNKEEIQLLFDSGANVFIVDSAHGHSKNVGSLVEYLSEKYKDIVIIAGNVVTAEGAKFLIDKGAHGVKVGVGPGSICITRKVTGVGFGQLTAISDVAEVCKKHNVLTIADGGIRSPDEIMKAIVAGADLVMLGYMLAGMDECPGKKIVIDNEEYKLYRGMGCLSAMSDGSSERYNYSTTSSTKWVPEGIESYIKAKGKAADALHQISWGLRSAFGYVGAKNIADVHKNVEFVRITNSVLKKSDAHSIDKVIETKK